MLTMKNQFTLASHKWERIASRARSLAAQRRKRNRAMALKLLRKALPDFALTAENVGYNLACARNWFLDKTGTQADFAHKALAYWDDWRADNWADAVSRKAWNKYVVPTI
jgi:hypothetical protein